MADPADITVTAIVVGFNHANCLGRCFDSLFGSRGLARLEVIYIDNASEDSSVAATSWHDQIRVVENSENLGFAGAVNQGLGMAEGNYVALVNPDTQIGPDCLRALVDRLRQDAAAGLVGPMLLNEEGHRQVSLAPYPTLRQLARRWIGRPAPPADRCWLVGALVVAEAGLLRQLGGLDEKYFVYGEDMDLSYRVQQQGRTVQVDDRVQITHTGNPRWSAERLVRVYGAYMRFAADHLGARRLPLGLMLSTLWLLRGPLAGAGRHQLSDGLRRIWSRQRDRAPDARFY